MEARLWNALAVAVIKEVAFSAVSNIEHASSRAIEGIAIVADVTVPDAGWLCLD